MLSVPAIVLAALLAQAQPAPLVSEPAEVPTTQPTLEQLRAEHKQLIEQEFSALPTREPLPITKIVSIKVDEGHLHVQPLMEATSGAVAIDAPDWPGKMMVTVGDPKTLTFSLKHVDLSRKDEIASYTHVITGVDYLQINRDTETDTGLISITLIQSRQFADENDDPIRVSVRQTSDEEGGPELNVTWSAASFEQLRRSHSAELRKYLLPILRDLRAGGLLRASDPSTAWQVLGQDATIDAKLKERVDQLVEKLAAADFATRAGAEEELATLGAPAAAAMSRMDLSRLATDPRSTIDNIIHSNQPLAADRVKAMRNDYEFLLDTLLLDDIPLRKAAIARLGDLTGKSITLPETLSPADREKKVESLRAQFAPATQPATQPTQTQ